MGSPRRLPVPVGIFVGLTTLDVLHRVRRPPGPDEKVTAISQELAAGGPAANAAVVFAALGGTAVLVTSLGAHPLAATVADDLARHGVILVDATPERPDAPAVSAIRVDHHTGHRSVSSTDATGVDARPPADLAERVAAADVVLLDGHHPALASAAAAAGSAARVSVVLDGGSWKPVVGEIAPVLHSAVCSEVFRLPGDRPASDLRGLGVPRVAVTRGPRSVRWCTAAGAGEVAVPPVQVRDTLAAGDAFHGAYAYVVGLRPDGPFSRALELAARVASFRCTVVGSRAWLATPEFVVLAKEVQRSACSSPTRRAEGQNRGTEDDVLGYGPEGV